MSKSLGLTAPAFRQIEQANRKFIEAIVQLMSKRMKKQVRLVAVQYAGDVFPHDDLVTRYIQNWLPSCSNLSMVPAIHLELQWINV